MTLPHFCLERGLFKSYNKKDLEWACRIWIRAILNPELGMFLWYMLTYDAKHLKMVKQSVICCLFLWDFSQSSCEIRQKYGFQLIDRKREKKKKKQWLNNLPKEHEMFEGLPWSILLVLKSRPLSVAKP